MRPPLLLTTALCAAALAFAATPQYGYRIVRVYPHDREAFTQGLEYRGGFLYESTGLRGRSSVRKVQLDTGEVLQQIHLEPSLFGEGITILNDRIIQLTWQAHLGFVYDWLFFRQLRKFQYPGEGWGLTNDGKLIYMSDGTAQIRVWDPVTFQEHKRFTVHDGRRAVANLNELEWVRNEIYANVWETDRIARISPVDGRVTAWIDLTGLLTRDDLTRPVDVLNGIAYDAGRDRLFVTGKLWPKLFEIRLVPKR
jgi:glutaminyl-peptide cyclotransferase